MRVLDQGCSEMHGMQTTKDTKRQYKWYGKRIKSKKSKLLEVVRMQNQSPGPFLLQTQLEKR